MTTGFELLEAPAPDEGQAWFDAVAALLLNGAALWVDGALHRLREVEVYYRSEGHPDPFAHGAAEQETVGRWYFHREGGQYRGGSFKGLDISFGPQGVVGGVLIRTLETPEGALVNGCSLCVDHLLDRTGYARVAELDAALGARHVWEEGGPLRLVLHEWEPQEVIATARVGLTLKRMHEHAEMPAYLMRPYRFLTDGKIKKGKPHTIMALHRQGLDADALRRVTGVNKGALASYIACYEAGKALGSFRSLRSRDWSTEDLFTAHGVWEALHGAAPAERFGELRSALAVGPGEQAWRAIVDEVEAARVSDGWDVFEAQALPYLATALAAWPPEIARQAPAAWIERLHDTWDEEEVEPPALEMFDGIYFPGDEDVFEASGDPVRPARSVPELALANVVALGGTHEAEPLDAVAHAYLRDCPYVAGVRHVRYEVEGHEYAASPLVAPEALWLVLSGAAWRGLEEVTLGLVSDDTLPIALPVQLRALTLIGDAGSEDGQDAVDVLHALEGSACLDAVRALTLRGQEWSEEFCELLCGAHPWGALEAVRIEGLSAFHLTDQGQTLAELVGWFTAQPTSAPRQLVVVSPAGFGEDELASVVSEAADGWSVRVIV